MTDVLVYHARDYRDIVGDPLYASEAQEAMAPRLLLHAQAIEVPHPATDQPMRFETPCPF